MATYKTSTPPLYQPDQEALERRQCAYDRLQTMMELKSKTMPLFSGPNGPRSWNQYVDDSERIMNGYTPSREEQGKEPWQSNVMDNITRAKLRAVVAGVGLKVPDMRYTAVNKEGHYSAYRAELMHQITRHSFLDGNPTVQSFMETWQMLTHGLVVEYDGYLSGGAKRKIISEYDSLTGEVKFKEEYVPLDGKPVSIILPPSEFFWWDMFIPDIQDQPRIAWVQRYSKAMFDQEFGKYPNHKYVRTKGELTGATLSQETLMHKAWNQRVENDDYEVFRLYDKEEDTYQVWVNGVELVNAPLLWGHTEKYYPFAKAISEPFANPQCFVGMSMPALLEGYQDVKTTILNTMVDKLYRSLKRPFLVGLGNKDLFDVEQELVDDDDRIYVPDVKQVTPFPYENVSAADLAMYNLMNPEIDRLSVDPGQSGIQTPDVTARAAIIADERARQLKGIVYMFLEDFWLQKHRLRNRTVLTQYLKDRAKRTNMKDRIITVPDVMFSDGKRGTLDVHVADSPTNLLPETEIAAREEAAEEQGLVYKLISITADYPDEYEYDYQVIPESLYNQDRLRQEADVMEKIERMITLDPERVAQNKDKLVGEMLGIYGQSVDDYPVAPPAPMAPAMAGAPAPGQPQPVPAGDAGMEESILGLE